LQQQGAAADTQIVEMSNYPLTVKVFPDSRLLIQMLHSDRFESATISRLLAHFVNLLEAIVSDAGQPPDSLKLLSNQERQQQLYQWNDTGKDYGSTLCLHQLFERQVKKTPQATALILDNDQLSYAELNRRANQLAHYLRDEGVGPEVIVGICMERSIHMVTGLLAIIKAGGAYVPLDPEYPQERLSFMVADMDSMLVLTQSHLLDRLPEKTCRPICVDQADELLRQRAAGNPSNLNKERNIAYIIYTSGSTGKPKGVMNTHSGIRNRLLWMQDTYGLSAQDRVLQKTTFSFDVSVWEFFWPLITGATLVLARPGGHRDSAYLVELIRQQAITTLHFVPPMLQMFMLEPDVSSCSSLRNVICSGEALPYDLQQRFLSTMSCGLHNLYGPTEAAIDVTAWDCRRQSVRPIVPIGHPIANTQIHILDNNLEPVPIGVAGELYIGGANLARGYLQRAALTAEKFVPNPFSTTPGARLYRSGDLARYAADASIEFLGRVDHQVKLRGFRIELGEIESVLMQHADVQESVLLARDDGPGDDRRLVTYVVLRAAAQTDVDALRRFLKRQLPDYMVPADFVIMEDLPLTQNGKIDRRALPAPLRMQQQNRGSIAPRNPLERQLADIWMQVLDCDDVGIDENFFDLGGHSLLMIKVNSRLNETFDRKIELVKLFEYPTIESLAAYLQQGDDEQSFQKGNDAEIVRKKGGGDRLKQRRSRMRKNETPEIEY
ncbi:MAG TPA: amino acid adenylation domain-containing protein, partial [Gammaproteobacteria bacterium]|nr:amino acid adenylation domain-containing protein [Gammaproteobacteria bacterium]